MAPTSTRGRLSWLSVLGLALVVAGVGGLGYVGWEYLGTNVVARHEQQRQLGPLHERWKSGEDPRTVGQASAILRIPRFGADFEVPIIAGVTEDDLSAGVGHQPGTADPGKPGNVVLAGHRVTHGEPFADFPDLRAGDRVTIITRTHRYDYRLDMSGAELEVDYSEGWVMAERPDHRAVARSDRLITLVTCAELFRTDQRLVAFGHLASVSTNGS